LAFRRARRVQLVADHAQRQELVALEPQDRLEPREVVLAEQAVAARRPFGADETLVLEGTGLRDRDVGKLVAEASDALADPDRPLALGTVRRGAHLSMKVSRYLPIWSSSPFVSSALSIRRRLTKVPLSEPWSSTENVPPSSTSTA